MITAQCGGLPVLAVFLRCSCGVGRGRCCAVVHSPAAEPRQSVPCCSVAGRMLGLLKNGFVDCKLMSWQLREDKMGKKLQSSWMFWLSGLLAGLGCALMTVAVVGLAVL
jgi:hypothetical protein